MLPLTLFSVIPTLFRDLDKALIMVEKNSIKYFSGKKWKNYFSILNEYLNFHLDKLNLRT